jgi:hypothetical protein
MEKCADSSMGECAAMPPPPLACMFLMKFSWCSIQRIQEGTANIAYQIARLHNWSNSEEDQDNHNTSNDTTYRTIKINHQKIKEDGGRKENNNAFKFGLIFSFSFYLFSAFVQVYICVAYSMFIYFQHA